MLGNKWGRENIHCSIHRTRQSSSYHQFFFFSTATVLLNYGLLSTNTLASSALTDDFGGNCPIVSASRCANLAAIPFGG